METITIWTVQQLLAHDHTVNKWCGKCGWLPDLDLTGLVEAGYGDRPPASLPLKCKACGTKVMITIQPPKKGGPVIAGVA